MVSQSILSSLQKATTPNLGLKLKPSILQRTHYSGPSGGAYHQHHHIFHHSNSGSGHSYSDHDGGKKKSIALSALTLLAFLFFLNILQNCLEEQMVASTASTQVVFLSAKQQLKESQKKLEDEKISNLENNDKLPSVINYERINKNY
ncbi:hypothetical protein RN001_003296 [Aquatica leii]|uniref:Uncharacterized protein n=1 Tax=Aquatica leii TaxID=1421715 RepID=A0AAN7ST01_9COLE|nr:hypothetical protein RN001_003296 [Aquatica leii]